MWCDPGESPKPNSDHCYSSLNAVSTVGSPHTSCCETHIVGSLLPSPPRVVRRRGNDVVHRATKWLYPGGAVADFSDHKPSGDHDYSSGNNTV